MKLKSLLITGAAILAVLIVFAAYSYYHFSTKLEELRTLSNEQVIEIDNLKSHEKTLRFRCSNLESEIYDHDSRIEELEAKIDDLESRIDDLE